MFASSTSCSRKMAKRASLPLLLLAALIGSAARPHRARRWRCTSPLHWSAVPFALVARPRYVLDDQSEARRSTIDDTDLQVDARILQAKQDLLERVYARARRGVPGGRYPS